VAIDVLAIGVLLAVASCAPASNLDDGWSDAGMGVGSTNADSGDAEVALDAGAGAQDSAAGSDVDSAADAGTGAEADAGAGTDSGPATISSYPKPAIYTSSDVYALTANGVDIPVVKYTDEYDYAHLSMSRGAAQLEITTLRQTAVTSYWISPKKLGIQGNASANKLTFSIANDEYLIVIINKQKKLVIAADPEETDKPLSSGPGIYNVTHEPYGADATGANLATTAIQRAIDDASSSNGGVVYVPAGVYLVGNLQLKSNVKLYLEGGAVLRCTGNPADYTTHFHKDSQKKDGTWWIHTADGATNMKIYGRGTLDGNGYYMRNTNKYVNNILLPLNCSHLVVDGIIFRDSGLWSFVIVRSNDVAIKNFKQFNYLSMLENDSIDVVESQNVTVTNAIAVSGDDPFSTKTWDVATTDIAENWYGTPEPLKNVTFDDCIAWTECQALKLGMGTKQPQTGVTFKNSVVYDSAKAIALQHSYGTAEVSDITFDNIDIEAVRIPRWGGPYWFLGIVENGSGLGTGPVTNVVLRNIRLREMGSNASVLRGYGSESAFKSVSFDNIILPDNRVATSLDDLNLHVNGYVDTVLINGKPVAPPDASGVVFYQDSYYAGTASQALSKGDYTLAQLQARGVVDNKASSLSVPEGWEVVVYENDNFSGNSCTFSANAPFIGTACNDNMSSCRIR
jgi:hypothetical protein